MQIELDRTDRKILTVLSEDGSLSAAEIADRVGLSQSPCWRRINRMEKEGVIRQRAAESPEGVHGRYLYPDRDPVEQTFGALEHRTRQFANVLADAKTPAGRVVLVVLQHHSDMLPAFYGAMWLGAIPAFLPFPTGRLHIGKYYNDMRALIRTTQPHALVTYGQLADELKELLAEFDERTRSGLGYGAQIELDGGSGPYLSVWPGFFVGIEI